MVLLSITNYYDNLDHDNRALGQALWGALAAGREKRGELANTSLEFEFHLQFSVVPRRLSCQISANQREAETSANVNKHRKTRAEGDDVITNVISANQHFASTFSMQIFKFQRRCCKLYNDNNDDDDNWKSSVTMCKHQYLN